MKKVLPPADDSTSADIDVPFGVTFGNTSQSTIYVWLEMVLVLCIRVISMLDIRLQLTAIFPLVKE